MNREKRLELLRENIQTAVDNYVYETGDEEFSAVVKLSADLGWTNPPEIVSYESMTEDC